MRKVALWIILSLWTGLTGCTSREEPQRGPVDPSITVYFTDPLAGLPAMRNFSAQANGLDRALIGLIDSAQRTLDVAVYSLSRTTLIDALGRACQRHVRVRLIIERESADSFPSARVEALSCVTVKLDQNSALMHEKFLVADESVVWVGSHNWTCLDMYFDANNALVIRDASVAAAFKSELEEMYNGRFGRRKLDLDRKDFRVGGRTLELYFAPSDAAREAIVRKIRDARSSIYVAMYAFTDNTLKRALLDAQARGVRVQAVWDYQGQSLAGSDVTAMLNRDLGVLEANPGLVHHKFAVVDAKTVVTGSANWTRAAFERNDENLLILEDPELASAYIAHWKHLSQDAMKYDREPLQAPRLNTRVFLRSEESSASGVRVEWRPHLVRPVNTYELCRSKTSQGPCEQTFSDLAPGSDFFVDESALPSQAYYYRLRGRVGNQWSDYSNEYSTRGENCP